MGIIGSCFKENTTKIPEKLNQAMKCLCNVNILNKINSGFLIKFQSFPKFASQNISVPMCIFP